MRRLTKLALTAGLLMTLLNFFSALVQFRKHSKQSHSNAVGASTDHWTEREEAPTVEFQEAPPQDPPPAKPPSKKKGGKTPASLAAQQSQQAQKAKVEQAFPRYHSYDIDEIKQHIQNTMKLRRAATGNVGDRAASHRAPAGQSAPKESKESKESKSKQPPTGKKDINCDEIIGDVHMVWASTQHEYGAMLASAYSALKNSKDPSHLALHFVIPIDAIPDELCDMVGVYATAHPESVCPIDDPYQAVNGTSTGMLRACGTMPSDSDPALVPGCSCGSQFQIVQFDPGAYPVLEHIRRTSQDRKELMSSMNFARNFFDDLLLPLGVPRIIYLDADTIVQGDALKLWHTHLTDDLFFAAPLTCNQDWAFWFNFKAKPVMQSSLKQDGCSVNAGVYLVDLEAYRQHRIQKKIASLIELHEDLRKQGQPGVWLRGVHQPSFILALFNHAVGVDAKWNVGQLGWSADLKKDDLKSGLVLHWNGKRKPWLVDGLYQSFWLPYALPLPPPKGAMVLGSCLHFPE